jgi:hypothetical protein
MSKVAHPTRPPPIRIARVTASEIEQLERSFAAIERSLELLKESPLGTYLGKRTEDLPSPEPATHGRPQGDIAASVQRMEG